MMSTKKRRWCGAMDDTPDDLIDRRFQFPEAARGGAKVLVIVGRSGQFLLVDDRASFFFKCDTEAIEATGACGVADGFTRHGQ